MGVRIHLENTSYCLLNSYTTLGDPKCPSASKLCQFTRAGDCHQTPGEAGVLSPCVPAPLVSVPRPITLPFWVVPVLLITVWAAGPNPLPQEQGQAQQKTSLVSAEFTIVLLLHMALES